MSVREVTRRGADPDPPPTSAAVDQAFAPETRTPGKVRSAHPSGSPPRRGESGQALLFALLALLLASIAAAFVAEDLSLRERALQEEAARLHVRGLLDGALADALARLQDRQPLVELPPWGGGITSVERIDLPADRVILRVSAVYKARRGAAEAQVLLRPSVRVLSWHRGHAGG